MVGELAGPLPVGASLLPDTFSWALCQWRRVTRFELVYKEVGLPLIYLAHHSAVDERD